MATFADPHRRDGKAPDRAMIQAGQGYELEQAVAPDAACQAGRRSARSLIGPGQVCSRRCGSRGLRHERLVKNEQAARAYNNRRLNFEVEDDTSPVDEDVPFLCGCGDEDCAEAMETTPDDFMSAHSGPTGSPSSPAT